MDFSPTPLLLFPLLKKIGFILINKSWPEKKNMKKRDKKLRFIQNSTGYFIYFFGIFLLYSMHIGKIAIHGSEFMTSLQNIDFNTMTNKIYKQFIGID